MRKILSQTLIMRYSAIFFFLWFFSFALSVPRHCAGEELEAVTKPSADIEISFIKPGKVAGIVVKEGDAVQAGQLLARLDDKVEQLQLLQLQAKSRDKTRVEAAEAEMLQKIEDLKKFEGAGQKGAATEWEVEHARLNVRIARLSVQLAKVEHEQDRLKYEELKADLERLRLLSPVTGFIEEVILETGESAQPLKTAIRLVRTDPLWIDVIAPISLARKITPGQSVSVAFPGHGASVAGEKTRGRVIFVSGVARAASDTLRLRVEVPNPGRRPAGERVTVSLPDS